MAQVPAATVVVRATKADSDEALLESWLESLTSKHSRRNFERTARRFLSALPMGLRDATVEDVRDAIATVTATVSPSTTDQYTLRIKSLLSYGHKLGFLQFNAGTVIAVKRPAGNRGAAVAKRIVDEFQVRDIIKAARTRRDHIMLATLYASGMRVSELVALTWADVLPRAEGKAQLHIRGKGGVEREVLLDADVGQPLLSLRGEAHDDAPVFLSRKGGHLHPTAVLGVVKRAARNAGVHKIEVNTKEGLKSSSKVSCHWMRHAHASHAIASGATLVEVQETLGHGNISTTSAYLHARPDSSSALRLKAGQFLAETEGTSGVASSS
jgi:integrase/recombinase XerD